jgi:hypothetical protein
MPTVRLCPVYNGWQAFGNTGLTLNGGKVYTYAAGTTTPQATYTDNSGGVANANPIVLDSAGRPPAEVWLIEGDSYKLEVKDSLGNSLATYDNIIGIHDFLAGSPNFSFAGTQFFQNVNIAGQLTFGPANAPRIKADFSNATIANRLIFQSSTVNGNTDMVAIPNGISTQSSFNLFNGTDTANSGFGHIAISNGEFALQSSRTGVGVSLPMTFAVGNAGTPEAMRISLANNQLLIATSTESPVTGAKLRVNGIVQIDNAVAFHVTTSAASNIPNTTFTQVGFNTVTFNQNSSFNIATGRFTPPAGKYALMVNAGNTGSVDQARWLVMIYKNGVVLASFNATASGVAAQNAHISVVVDANGTDYFEGYVWQNSGGNYTLSNTAQDTFFCGYRIG